MPITKSIARSLVPNMSNIPILTYGTRYAYFLFGLFVILRNDSTFLCFLNFRQSFQREQTQLSVFTRRFLLVISLFGTDEAVEASESYVSFTLCSISIEAYRSISDGVRILFICTFIDSSATALRKFWDATDSVMVFPNCSQLLKP